jgi:short-subunit dehydrogenase
MTQIQDKVVWITGASSGIGEAMAHAFAKKGAILVLTARRENELQRVQKELGLPAEKVMILPMDVTQFETAQPLAEQVVARFGRIDIMVQNAGISQRSKVIDTDLKVYQELMDVNFFSGVALTKAVLPYMKRQQSGHFVVTSSVAGKIGTPQRSGYNAAKHAVQGFYDALRAEVYEDNIEVTIHCPGYIKTNISLNALDAQGNKFNKMDENQANGISAEECARQVIEAVEQNKKEIIIGGFKETAGVYLKRFFPSILYKMVIKNAPK